MQTIIVDCDGVIADKKNSGKYSEAEPLKHGIEQVNKLYDSGKYTVVLHTARYGDREHGNIHRQYERGYTEWLDWLDVNEVKYHHAFMGKIAGALYIDDKAARVTGDDAEGWNNVWREVEDLEGRDQYGNKRVPLVSEQQMNYWDSFI